MTAGSTLGPSPAQVARMSDRIATRIVELRRRRRRRVRVAIATGSLLAIGSLTAAGFAVSRSEPEVRAAGYACYFADDRNTQPQVIGFPTDLEPPTTTTGQVAAALELCDIAYGAHGQTVTDPVVCELPDLRLAVFPNARALDGDEFCASLGLGDPLD